MKNKARIIVSVWGSGMICLGCAFLLSCAGQRQGLVCEEIEYRLNSMSYSPDQRYYMEEELRTCREEEAKKKGSSGKQQSIYERYASQDTVKTVHTASDTIPAQESKDISVSEMLQDSSGKDAPSIYDRYGSENPQAEQDSSSASPADSAVNEVPQE